MLVFVDESGDPGLKLDRAASHFFVVTAVPFDDHDQAERNKGTEVDFMEYLASGTDRMRCRRRHMRTLPAGNVKDGREEWRRPNPASDGP